MLYAPSRGLRVPLVCGTLLLAQPYPLKLPPCLQAVESHPGTAVRHYFGVGAILRRCWPLLLASFYLFAGLTPPVLFSMAAFLRLPIRGCLPKGRATHSLRYMVIPGFFLLCSTEEAPRLPGAGTLGSQCYLACNCIQNAALHFVGRGILLTKI